MRPSRFNVSVPVRDGEDVFLMNTLTDAQAIVSTTVLRLLERIDTDPAAVHALDPAEREVIAELAAQGFLVESREAEDQSVDRFFAEVREDTSELRVTVLTTLQCNFACDYCIQGDHGDYNRHATKMTLDTAEHVAAWVETRLDATGAERFGLTFFGGEPLLNLPVLYALSERLSDACRARGVGIAITIITNGLLLTPEIVDRLTPLGLAGVKVTLDGDRTMHDLRRPLRGGQGTFDRIVENLRRVAGKTRIAIGGNFDETTVDSYPALLDFLREQEFADQIGRIAFKPIVRTLPTGLPAGSIPLSPVGESSPVQGNCMSSVGAGGVGGSSPCDSCHFVDEKMAFLRDETTRRGFPTPDGVHMGPCEIHKRHAYTIGTDGTLFACPGFAGEASYATGHITAEATSAQARTAERFEELGAWKNCGDCAFVPVCGGGCTVASQAELGDMNAPSCHLGSFETALVSLARTTAAEA